jgi:3-methyladenine DNA glycosylase AlkD
MGTEQNRKTYQRHCSGPNLFGVSFANLGKLAKQIKTDHALALQLWATGNADARNLATMIADPKQATEKQLDAWANDMESGFLVCTLAKYAGATRFARAKAEQWMASDSEWIACTGWMMLATLAERDETLTNKDLEAHLKTIERGIHTAKNKVRDTMNTALIAIGIRNPALQAKALAAARRIGKVEVDHGDTGCKTPDAAAYILKTVKYREAKVAARSKC